MRISRLLGAILTVLTAAALVAPAAAAQPPLRLADYVTDRAGVLSGSGRAEVQAAVGALYTEHTIRLWVVYVDSFAGNSADSWGAATARLSDLGGQDALLAVATGDRSYVCLVSSAVRNLSSRQVDELRHNQIEPALHRGEWSGAAIAAATGLGRATTNQIAWGPMLVGLTVVACAAVMVMLVLRYRRHRR